jgi:3-hexulose-6-phosphate synthase / 6-phospho-3-hexuloisomerase
MAARLQLALDFAEKSRALGVAKEAAEGGVDILEVGTPLLKSEGLDAVRALRREFPKHAIVADTKTMDAGRVEMETAAKAGANYATVLGAASESTIRECIEVARNYGLQVVVDLVSVEDYVKRAKEAEAWGAHVVSVHCPIDEQMRGQNPFERLRRVREAVRIEVAVAGGINSETAGEAVATGADIVIVGGAITKAESPALATRTIRRAMAEKVAIETELFKRVGPDQIRSVLEKVSTPNVSDAMHRSGELQGLLPISPGFHMVGPAVTVRTYPGDWAKPVQAIERCQPGDVIVIDAGSVPPAVWGELATESCLQQKVAGVVIDGAIRDVDAIRKLGFAAFARHLSPTAWEPKGFGEIGVPIKVAGRAVEPGDWIVGDDSGVVVIPKARAVEVANRAMDVLEKENRLREEIRRAKTLSEVAELLRWEKKH